VDGWLNKSSSAINPDVILEGHARLFSAVPGRRGNDFPGQMSGGEKRRFGAMVSKEFRGQPTWRTSSSGSYRLFCTFHSCFIDCMWMPTRCAKAEMNLFLKVTRKVFRAPVRLVEYLEARRQGEGCVLGEAARLHTPARIFNFQDDPGAIAVGAHTQVLGQLCVLGHGGRIRIGESCFIGEDSRIWAAASITIGDRVLISHNVNIHDNNSHSLSAEERHWHFNQIISTGHPKVLNNVAAASIVIEDDAWIGFGCTILKGVTVGRGAVVGACSLVTKDVAAYTVVAGSPAKAIGNSRP
jgi:acetyltransferase-like isoleucine patch superfamily enzyme